MSTECSLCGRDHATVGCPELPRHLCDMVLDKTLFPDLTADSLDQCCLRAAACEIEQLRGQAGKNRRPRALCDDCGEWTETLDHYRDQPIWVCSSCGNTWPQKADKR